MRATRENEAEPPHWPRIKAVLGEALERSEPDRSAFLNEACEGEPALRTRVEALLALEPRAVSALRPPGVALAGVDDSERAALEARIEKLVGQIDTRSRYEELDEIGRGGMGRVLRVLDKDLGRELAMKVTDAPMTSSPSSEGHVISHAVLSRFLAEAQVTGQLDHPGIVPVHELGVDHEGRLYFTMRLVPGRDLRTVFELVRTGQEDWTVTRALNVLSRVCDAMAYAHAKGVIHRDLKPANVMVGRFGEVYVMDWGLARVIGQEDRRDLRLKTGLATGTFETARGRETDSASDDAIHTMEGTVVGTPVYMSPEQARGETDDLDARTDVYAVGAMLYHLLAGQMPYAPPGAQLSPRSVLLALLKGAPEPLHRVNPDVAPELVAICEKAMARERSRRYTDMSELAEELRAYLEHRVVSAYKTGPVAELGKWVARNRSLAAALTAVALVLVAGLGAALVLRQQAENERQATASALMKTRAVGLASTSEEVLESDGMLALLLAREAVRVDRTPETLSRLQQAVRAVRERTILRHTARFVDAVFSPEGDTILAISKEVAFLWDLESGEATTLEGHGDGWLLSGSFSSSGDYVLTSSQDDSARLWDRNGSSPLATFAHDGDVWTATFSPDERFVLTASDDGAARIWGRENDTEPLAVLRGPAGAVLCATFSPDGRLVLTGSVDGVGRLWRFLAEEGTAEHVADLVGHEGAVSAAAFSPVGDRIVTGSGVTIWSSTQDHDDTARVWDLSGNELALLWGHAGGVESVAFSPDGTRILTASSDRTGRLWDLQGRTLAVLSTPSNGNAWMGSFSPDGTRVALGCSGGTAWLFDLWGKPVGILSGHEGTAVSSVRFSPDSRSIATASMDGTARIWRAVDEEIVTLHGHGGRVNQAKYSPDGTMIATTSWDGTARIWSLQGGQLAVLRGHGDTVNSIEFSPDGNLLITASSDKTARLWDLDANELRVYQHDPAGSKVLCASFSPNGDRIVTGRGGGSVTVWDVEGTERERFEFPGRPVNHVEFVLDGEHLLLASQYAPDVLVLSLEDGSTRSLGYGGMHATCSASGDRVLISCADGRVVVVSMTGELLRVLDAHERLVTWASFSSSAGRIVTASVDGTARIWNASGDLEATLRGHAGGVRCAVFSPAGDRVLTASSDGTARTWIVETEELAKLAESRTTRTFTPAELLRYEGLLGVPASEAQTLVNALFEELSSKEAVIAHLRTNAGLDGELREVALRFATEHAER
jgi:WD40 repeat protein/serine/threonine protein kinase